MIALEVFSWLLIGVVLAAFERLAAPARRLRRSLMVAGAIGGLAGGIVGRIALPALDDGGYSLGGLTGAALVAIAVILTFALTMKAPTDRSA